MPSSSFVKLGLVKKTEAWKLLSYLFPSKVGGLPAWLRLDNLPDRSKLLCSSCNQPLVFLMQVYANIDDIESAFHRTLFVFICTSNECSEESPNKNMVVLRNQLPRKNNFYSLEKPEAKKKALSYPSAEKYQALCCICSLPASCKCSKCNDKNYCCEDHQAKDWEWNHKVECGQESQSRIRRKKMTNNFLLPEFGLEMVREVLPNPRERSDAERMKDYEVHPKKSDNTSNEMQDISMEELDEIVNIRKDKAYNKFKKRSDIKPEQVLRCERGGSPLWVSFENVPTEKDIPNCSCGSERIFEFQIMPQLLNHLKLDSVPILRDGKYEFPNSIDWGTLAVYTCSKLCDRGTENYVEEFIWKQDFSKDKE